MAITKEFHHTEDDLVTVRGPKGVFQVYYDSAVYAVVIPGRLPWAEPVLMGEAPTQHEALVLAVKLAGGG